MSSSAVPTSSSSSFTTIISPWIYSSITSSVNAWTVTFRGGSREKSDQASTKRSWARLYGCGKYLRTMKKGGPVGPTFIIDLNFDILDLSKEAIKHDVHFVLLC